MKAYKIDVEGLTTGVIDIEDELEAYYRELDCDMIEIPVRYIAGKEFDIICDEEGLLKAPCWPSAVDKYWQTMLVGNLILCHHDDEGNMAPITDDDVDLIEENTMLIFFENHKPYNILINCEYEPEEEDE